MRPTKLSLRVLVVDDDPGIIVTLRDIFAAVGHQVEVASSGDEAVQQVKAFQPHCILMDIKMPGLNGVEAYRRMKQLVPDSFVIFMTANAASNLVEDAHLEGAVDVLAKPLDLERVLELIEETAARTSVLVVDDDTDFGRSLSELLTGHGFSVHLAVTAEEAIAHFARQPRQVVLLDMKLGGRTGLDVLRIVRGVNPQAIVFLMTGFPDLQEELQAGLEMSATDCFTKPFEIPMLVDRVRRAVDRRHLRG